jgi:Pathogenicity locus
MKVATCPDAEKRPVIKTLMQIPGVGISIAHDLWNIGIRSVTDLQHKDPEALYHLSNKFAGVVQDRCLLYVFRCAVYYASSPKPDPRKLKWWYWKDKSTNRYPIAIPPGNI